MLITRVITRSEGCWCCYYHLGERDLPLASEGVFEEHAGHGLEHREDQRGRGHVPTKRE